MYRDLPISQRLDKIGELLAKGVYLYVKKEKEKEAKCLKEKKERESSKYTGAIACREDK
ncbi:MAG: hypothetical protein KBD53_04705 [Candidatus Omnitrophica bacterium]|nr:hypothetical protein [Candidatus Omnitrophota bacterium]